MVPALASPRITTRGGCYPTIAASLRRRFTNQKTVLECPELLAKLEGELPSWGRKPLQDPATRCPRRRATPRGPRRLV